MKGLWSLLGVVFTLFGCGLSSPPEPVQNLHVYPPQWQSPHHRLEVKELWPQLSRLPRLQSLVLEGLKNNPELQLERAKVDGAVARVYQIRAVLWPEIGAFISARRQDSGQLSNNFQLGGDVSWEVDFLGKLNDQSKAALFAASRSINEFRFQRLSLVARVSSLWFDLLEAQLQLKLVRQRRLNLQQDLDIVESGYQSGLNSSLDVFLARADVAGALANEEVKSRELNRASQNMELSLGRYPAAKIRSSAELALDITQIPVGLPSELLTRRADIRGAQDNLSAANASLSVAYKQRFPSLKLTGSLGYASPELSQLLTPQSLIWSVFANVSAPVFNAGGLKAQQTEKVAEAQQAAALLTQTILIAFSEVERALLAEGRLAAQEQHLNVAVENSVLAEELAFEQYRAGLTSYITVLESTRRAFDSQSAAISVRNQRLQNRINLFLAIGGSIETSVSEQADKLIWEGQVAQ